MESTIEFYRSNSNLMRDAIDRLVVEVYTYKQKMGYCAFLLSGCGSESGTTTLCINLAIELSAAGWKTIFVDCDLRKGTKYKKFTKEMEIGLSEYLEVEEEKKEIIYQTNYDLLEVIPSGKIQESPIPLLCSRRMEELMQELKAEYDYVIYDFPSLNIVPDVKTVYPYIDGIILVAALNQTTKRQVEDARRIVEQCDNKYCGLVVNRVEIPQYKKYIKDYDYFKINNMNKKLKNITNKEKNGGIIWEKK